MTHGQHAKATQLLWCVEDDWWETAGHFTVQPDLDTSLNLQHQGNNHQLNKREHTSSPLFLSAPFSPFLQKNKKKTLEDCLLSTSKINKETGEASSSPNLVLAFDKQVKELLCVDNSLTEVRHQTNQGSVPLVDDLNNK